MQNNFKEFFEVDQNEVNNYLDLFDKDLINPDRYSDLDINKPIADFSNKEAIRLMVIKYFYGIGVEVNKQEGIAYLHIASQRGDSISIFLYARSLQKGRGVPVDKEKAA